MASLFLPPIVDAGSRRPAPLTSRVAAHLFDAIVVNGALQAFFLVVFARGAFVALAEELASASPGADGFTAALVDALLGDASTLLWAVFAAWLTGGVLEVALISRVGATFGKMVFRLEVVDASTGNRLSFGRAALRWLGLGWMAPAGLVSPLLQLVPLAGYALAWFDPCRRALHDRLTGALVVERPTTR